MNRSGTASAIPPNMISEVGTSQPAFDAAWFRAITQAHADLAAAHLTYAGWSQSASWFASASQDAGGVVIISPRYACLPVMIGNDGEPISLYRFVEVIDEVIEYDDIRREFPTLTYGQIAGGIAFLRALTQFNVAGVDIDELDEAEIEGSQEFQAAVLRALNDREVTRVLTTEQRNG